MIGKTISHYQILEQLGVGGMGVVYRAQDFRLLRHVAIKMLHTELTRDEKKRARFIHEARITSSLNHPNICTIYEIDEYEGQHFIVMELVEGETLREIVERRGPLPEAEAVDIAIKVCDALAAVHDKGIVHRDIKPANIMVKGDGRVKVMDFGLAKMELATPLTNVGTIIGTVAYMSPEQVRGETVDHRSDLWSLGTVLYEMITGSRPFRGEHDLSILYAILNEKPAPLESHKTDIPQRLSAIVLKALEKDANNRYQSAVELLADMEPIRPTGSSSFVADKPFIAETPLPSRLPLQLTSFIGREQEMAQVKALLSATRLLTLTGPGGTGKTRLSLQVAAELLDDFAEGVFFVSLAPIGDAGLVVSTIAQALEVRARGDISVLNSLKEFLRDKHLLLVLDNFEHVMPAASLVMDLLTSCPSLKTLVTSREPLHLSGEQEFPVPPLILPDLKVLPSLESLAQFEAIALFTQRAQAVKPGFILSSENAPAVAEICVHLDGLPLAIELAAARIKVLPPKAMLARIGNRLQLLSGGVRDLPARQQTLRGAIAWSCDLLNESEKRLFRRLAVFAGGCTYEAAKAVCNATADPKIEMLDGLVSLVEKSLIQQMEQPDGEPRFVMLETINAFGLECLEENGEADALRDAHLRYFLDLAVKAEPCLTGRDQKVWLEKLKQEQDNLRGALAWCLNKKDVEAGLQLGAALVRFWLVCGDQREGQSCIEELIEIAGTSNRTATLAKLYTGAGILAQTPGDYLAAAAYFRESLAIWRQIGDKKNIATSLNHLGWAAWRIGDYAATISLSQEGLALHRELGDERGIATSLTNLEGVAFHQGDYAAALAYGQEGLTLRQKLGEKRGIAFSQIIVAWAMSKLGDYDQATSLLEQARAQFRELEDKQLFAFATNILASAARDHGNHEQAAKLVEEQSLPLVKELGSTYGTSFALTVLGDARFDQAELNLATDLHEKSLAIRRESGDKWGVAQSLHRLGVIAGHQADYPQAMKLHQESLVLRMELEDRAGIAECMDGLAAAAGEIDQHEGAARLIGAAEALRETIRAPLPLCDRANYEKNMATIRAGLSGEAFEAAREKGRRMTLEQAVEFALQLKSNPL